MTFHRSFGSLMPTSSGTEANLEAISTGINSPTLEQVNSICAAGETNPKKAYGDKKPRIGCIPPIALFLEGIVMSLGAKKYGAYNWNTNPVDAMTYIDAAISHIMLWQTGEDNDPLIGPDGKAGSGVSHLAHARACLAILIDAQAMGNLVDNRPKTASISEAIWKFFGKEKPKD